MQRGLVGSEMCIRDRRKGTQEIIYREGDVVFITLDLKALSLIVQGPSIESIVSIRYGIYYPCFELADVGDQITFLSVSYTHLTLPTILLVQISVVAASLKKKQEERKQEDTRRNGGVAQQTPRQ
eukprot:TRINITY_DN39472_c0_g1_i1.p3 TRINITY_DN39472_c0_g1~~TRINITY_DN39472_c0_g1_i1.p3  ORF type:complete len:125 (-),score=26.92 TRINITY_DN39472_c0_g1_i1:46-420(-)